MRVSLLLLVALLAHPLKAQPAIYVGPQVSILGIGASAEADFGMFSVSGEAGWLPVNSVAYEQNGVEYLMDASTISGLILANVSAGGSRFSFGAGLYFGGINGDGEARNIRGVVPVGDNIYAADDVGQMEVSLDFGGVAPAIMIGLRSSGFNFGVGAALTGRPSYTMSATGPIQSNQQFQDDLEQDRDDVQEALDNVPVMPLLRFGWQIGVSG